MKGKIFFMTMLFLLLAPNMQSQNLYLILLKGKVVLIEGGRQKHLKPNYRYQFSPGSIIKPASDSKFMVFNKNKIIEKSGTSGGSYTYENLKVTIDKQPVRTSFVDYIARNYKLSALQEDSAGSVVAGVDAWNQNRYTINEEEIYPIDSSNVATPNVRLKWHFNSRLIAGNLYVINEASNDTIYKHTAIEEGDIEIPLAKPGNYRWIIYTRLDKKTKLNLLLTRLTDVEALKAKAHLLAFKKNIESLSAESQEILLDDYFYYNRIIIE